VIIPTNGRSESSSSIQCETKLILTMDIKTFDELFYGLTNLKHETRVATMIARWFLFLMVFRIPLSKHPIEC